MKLSDFDYRLPDGLIAQSPASPRESARLMVLSRTGGCTRHGHVSDLPDLIRPSDVVVVNNTKVFKARLLGTVQTRDRRSVVELFLVRPGKTGWLALGKPGYKLKKGTRIDFSGTCNCIVSEKLADGEIIVEFDRSNESVLKFTDAYGLVPVPPYIKRAPGAGVYQTVYAKYVGSVAAPTAGFHLTNTILAGLRRKGVTICEITLHVGLGTFRPVRTQNVEDHVMHAEWVHVPRAVARTIMTAKEAGRRIVAIGTTTVRTLEGVAAASGGTLTGYKGDVGLFIMPGFEFRIVDAMLTNFHLPKSTLLVLVSAFAGQDNIKKAYETAVSEQYRFYSFGDAMFIA